MKLLFNTTTATLQPYPRADNEPVIGLDPSLWEMVLIQEPQPDHDPATHQLTPTEHIDLVARIVTRGWSLTPLPIEPPAPPADWLGFAGWLYGYPPIMDGMATARASRDPQGEPATTGLPAAMDEARLRQNYVAFALSWGQFLAASAMSGEALAAIVEKADACHLPAEFIAALSPAP
jgi:hypothetical protein